MSVISGAADDDLATLWCSCLAEYSHRVRCCFIGRNRRIHLIRNRKLLRKILYHDLCFAADAAIRHSTTFAFFSGNHVLVFFGSESWIVLRESIFLGCCTLNSRCRGILMISAPNQRYVHATFGLSIVYLRGVVCVASWLGDWNLVAVLRDQICIFISEYCICLLLLALLLGDSFDCLHELAFIVKLEQFFVTIFGEPCFYQAFKNDFDTMYCFFVDDGIDFVAHVPHILCCWWKSVPVSEIA